MEHNKSGETLYHIISVAFCVIAVLSNIISAKMVSLSWIYLSIPAGLITYPLTFLLSGLVSEIFGSREARRMVYIAFGMNLLSFGIIQIVLSLPTEDLLESQNSFQAVFGLSGLRIFSSLFAYVVAQLVDIQVYAWIRRWTGSRFLWLKNNGSTSVAQMIDTLIIDLIFLYWGLGMPMSQVLPIMLFSYTYKVVFSLLGTPLFYFGVLATRRKLIYN